MTLMTYLVKGTERDAAYATYVVDGNTFLDTVSNDCNGSEEECCSPHAVTIWLCCEVYAHALPCHYY